MRTTANVAARAAITAGLTLACVLVAAAAASAKAPPEARIDGPGISTPIVVKQVMSKQAWAEDDPVRLLAERTGLWGGIANGESPEQSKPAGDLGPAYTVTFPGWAELEVYPYSDSGPWTYIRSGPSWAALSGWLHADPAVVPLLHDLGVPESKTAQASSGEAHRKEASTVGPIPDRQAPGTPTLEKVAMTGDGTGDSALWPLALAGMAFLAMTAAITWLVHVPWRSLGQLGRR